MYVKTRPLSLLCQCRLVCMLYKIVCPIRRYIMAMHFQFDLNNKLPSIRRQFAYKKNVSVGIKENKLWITLFDNGAEKHLSMTADDWGTFAAFVRELDIYSPAFYVIHMCILYLVTCCIELKVFTCSTRLP